jgi:4'-phosphopantetheinyl transferase
VRSGDEWLSPAEVTRLNSFRVPKRREDWRLGRWTAKNAVATYLRLPVAPSTLAAIEIRAAACGAPEAFLHGQPAALAISLTHRGGSAVCAIVPQNAVIGCDLELIEPRTEAFLADYFTRDEQRGVAQASGAEKFLSLSLLWSTKESTLKALREGLRIDTRQVEVTLGETAAAPRRPEATGGWRPLTARFQDRLFAGWWRHPDGSVLTIVGEPGLPPPLQLAAGPQLIPAAAGESPTSSKSTYAQTALRDCPP